MVALPTDYNHHRNPGHLNDVTARARRHNDINDWRSMMTMTQHHGDSATLVRLEADYCRLFPEQVSDNARHKSGG